MKLQKTKFDIAVDIICLLCLFGLIIYLVVAWQDIPDEIPGHYNSRGEIDKITGKGSLIILVVMAWVLYIATFIVEMFPKTWNTWVKVTKENMAIIYGIVKSLLGTMKLLMVLLFTYLTVNSSLALPLPALFSPILLTIVSGCLAFFIMKLIKAKEM